MAAECLGDFQPMTEHEHSFRLVLGPDGHGQLFGDYEGYVRQCACGENAPDYADFLEGFHDCPSCGKSHRIAKAE